LLYNIIFGYRHHGGKSKRKPGTLTVEVGMMPRMLQKKSLQMQMCCS